LAAVVADVVGQSLQAGPGRKGASARVHGGPVPKAPRELQHCTLEQYGDRVEIACAGGQTEAKGFEGNRPAATEGIYDRGQTIGIAPVDLCPSLLENPLVICCLPAHEPTKQIEEPVPLE